ncbi:hypothetical protein HCEG_08652 [Histoplasma capsulatum var. duboisii H88]|uniref:Uncharacterized protein n=1 Tax=Ajellomyces capsulatus (strain H88) TaxID=544711 RepID=F0UU60_AJEC8|nr:hypothetical protein HCEG_08652 [Histoplasma capsulatum var. duboisii H88]
MWDTPRQKARNWLAEEGWCSRSQRKKVNKEDGDGGEDMLKNTASNPDMLAGGCMYLWYLSYRLVRNRILAFSAPIPLCFRFPAVSAALAAALSLPLSVIIVTIATITTTTTIAPPSRLLTMSRPRVKMHRGHTLTHLGCQNRKRPRPIKPAANLHGIVPRGRHVSNC